MTVQKELLRRFHEVLVHEIRESNPEYLEAPFTVAEIYQHLVPYRTHRDEIGVEMNGDYEDVLLRLLGGEGDFLILESEPALKRIRSELKEADPNTGLFREFAAAEVRLNPDRVRGEQLRAGVRTQVAREARDEDPGSDLQGALEGLEEGRGREAGSASAGAPAVSPATPTETPAGGPRGSSSGNGEAHPAAFGAELVGEIPSDCPDCHEGLPAREGLRFCPHCGANVHLIPCPDCRADLERGWSYCIYCGTSVEG